MIIPLRRAARWLADFLRLSFVPVVSALLLSAANPVLAAQPSVPVFDAAHLAVPRDLDTPWLMHAGDNLKFGTANPPDCTESLGLFSCVSLWGWNIEGTVVVSDNAANWTIKQSLTGAFKGSYTNASGTNVPFFGTLSNPNDIYNSLNFQNTAGQTTLYFIDGPGGANTDTVDKVPYPVYSLTLVQNFTTTLCSTTATDPPDCQTITWYSKLAVDPGGKLDTTNSSSGYGSQSLNF